MFSLSTHRIRDACLRFQTSVRFAPRRWRSGRPAERVSDLVAAGLNRLVAAGRATFRTYTDLRQINNLNPQID